MPVLREEAEPREGRGAYMARTGRRVDVRLGDRHPVQELQQEILRQHGRHEGDAGAAPRLPLAPIFSKVTPFSSSSLGVVGVTNKGLNPVESQIR